MPERPNILFLMADQLRAQSLRLYGESPIATPHIDRLAAGGVTFTQAISTYPVCTPYRSMLLTGRHPQTTGHFGNFLATRHDEISVADAFSHAGYRTGWVGKWHLHVGAFPNQEGLGPEYIPEGRDRLGFDYFRAYNYRTEYFNGWVCKEDWQAERWDGFETEGLLKYAFEFLARDAAKPFCLFVSPHQPHFTGHPPFAPEEYYRRLPKDLALPPSVPKDAPPDTLEMYRHYLAMTLTVDDMLGALLARLDQIGQAQNTLVVFASDHGTMMGGRGLMAWSKKLPYEEAIHVPLLARLPGVLEGGRRCDALTAPVDLFPTFCELCGVRVPRSVEGVSLAGAWRGQAGAPGQDAVLTMNCIAHSDLAVGPEDPRYLARYMPWRGVRTREHSYIRWLDGRVELYDLKRDPRQQRNLADDPAAGELRARLEKRLEELQALRGDRLQSAAAYANWLDDQRRVIRNAFGPMGDPEQPPDWSLLA